ncbi:MAG: serine hydrolase [Planctomycetes bacterium]|nr:serine hydrolase [Planctomycetota bacterium]
MLHTLVLVVALSLATVTPAATQGVGKDARPTLWVAFHCQGNPGLATDGLSRFHAALDAGATWLACDVSELTDGTLVVATGTDGSTARAPSPPAPTLDEVFHLLSAHESARLAIRAERPVLDRALQRAVERGTGARCGAVVHERARVDVARERLGRDAAIWWTVERDADVDGVLAEAAAAGATLLMLHPDDATRTRIVAVHTAGLRVGVIAPPDRDRTAELIAFGADTLLTDRPAEARELAERQQRFSARVAELCDAHELASLAVGVVHGDRLVLAAVTGEARPGEPATLETAYRAGSVTKTLTAALLATLAADGTVALDDHLSRWLPEAELPDGGEAITLEQLATHTSGLPRMPPRLRPGPREPYGSPDAAALLACLVDTNLDNPPGVSVAYSNYGVALLGLALTRAAHANDFATLAEYRLLRPLGMTAAWVGDPIEDDPRTARGELGARRGQPAYPWQLGSFAPAGGLVATLPDLGRWVSAQLAAERGEDPAGLGAPLRATHVPRHDVAPGRTIGLGWFRVEATDDRPLLVWHNGAVGGFRAQVEFEPARDRGLIALTNRGFAPDSDPPAAILAAVRRLLDER